MINNYLKFLNESETYDQYLTEKEFLKSQYIKIPNLKELYLIEKRKTIPLIIKEIKIEAKRILGNSRYEQPKKVIYNITENMLTPEIYIYKKSKNILFNSEIEIRILIGLWDNTVFIGFDRDHFIYREIIFQIKNNKIIKIKKSNDFVWEG